MWTCPKCNREFDYQPPHHFCDNGASTIAEYIEGQDEAIQPRLWEVYRAIKETLPNATEKISWRMPTFYHKRNLIHFAAFKKHVGIYPGGEGTAFFAEKLKGYKTTKGGLQLPHDKPLPVELIKEIAAWCWKNNGSMEDAL